MKIEIFIYQKNNNKYVCFCGIYSVMIYTFIYMLIIIS